MGDAFDDREFRLPFQFLRNDDMLMDKENFNKNGLNAAWASFCFPSEFPYEFGSSSVLSSPVESVVCSTVTESDEDDRDLLFLSGLTRQLAHSTLQQTQKITCNSQHMKTWACPDSPQSTLSAVSSNGSPNSPQVSAPLSAPIEPWDLIYAVAGQFARLKTTGEGPPKARGLLGAPMALTPTSVRDPSIGLYSNQCSPHYISETSPFDKVRQDQMLKQQYCSIWGRPAKEGFLQQQIMSQNREEERFCGGSQSGWSPLCLQHQNQKQVHCGSGRRAVFLGGSGVKRKCAGTGVFLPRRYANPSDPSKNTDCSTALLPHRVVQALNNTQPQFNATFTSDYDAMRARRNAILAQQNRSLVPERAVNHEVLLPQEWTY